LRVFFYARWMTWLGAAVVASATAAQVGSRLRAGISTDEVTVQLQAGASAPRLVSLQGPVGAPWLNLGPDRLIDSVIEGSKSVPASWQLNPAASSVSSQLAVFVYESRSPRMRLLWTWSARSCPGPVEHSVSIENLSGEELLLPIPPSLSWSWRLAWGKSYEMLYVQKGGGKPSESGTAVIPLADAVRWTGDSSTYAREIDGRPREIIPFVLVQEKGSSHSGFYVGIEFSGRTRVSLDRKGQLLHGSAGLNPEPAPGRLRLAPGEVFQSPRVFLGAAAGGVDVTGNHLRQWARTSLADSTAQKDARYPYLVLNSWGSGIAIDETLARRMMGEAADLGFEMFHVDAGWFRGVGDWAPDPAKFPHGLAALADEAHHAGLKFGLWVGWTQAGRGKAETALNVDDTKIRNWMLADPPSGWQPEPFKGMTLDVGVPAIAHWARAETNRIVQENHLDMLEHDGYLVAQGCARGDHPHAPPDPANLQIEMEGVWPFVVSTNSTDVSLHATEAYYSIQDALRRKHPGLLLEICNDGGRMVDFGSAAHGDYLSITDAYDPVSNRRAFYDASHVLPPAMLETYVEKWPAPRAENFLYMLRSGMMGWLSLMQDPHDWTADQYAVAKNELSFYKENLRPLIRSADLYHLTPRPDGKNWDAIEYFDPASGGGAIFVFHGMEAKPVAHRIAVHGVRAERFYRLEFRDHPEQNHSRSGKQMLAGGIQINLPVANSSEIILLREEGNVAGRSERRGLENPAAHLGGGVR